MLVWLTSWKSAAVTLLSPEVGLDNSPVAAFEKFQVSQRSSPLAGR